MADGDFDKLTQNQTFFLPPKEGGKKRFYQMIFHHADDYQWHLKYLEVKNRASKSF